MFNNKSQVTTEMSTPITNDTQPSLTPGVGATNEIKASNLKAFLTNFIDWIFPAINPIPANDLGGKVLGVVKTGSSNYDYSNLSFVTMMPIGGITMYALNGFNKNVGGNVYVPTLQNSTNTADNGVLDGFLFCDGSSINLSVAGNEKYANLKTVLNGYYGNDIANNILRLPDMGGRVPMGYNKNQPWQNPDVNGILVNDVVNNNGLCGNTGGRSIVTIQHDNLPPHTHLVTGSTYTDGSHTHVINSPVSTSGGADATSIRGGSAFQVNQNNAEPGQSNHFHQINIYSQPQTQGSGSTPIDKRMTYRVVNYIIKY